jgi:hypothetical protein
MKYVPIFLSLILFGYASKAATCTATVNGNWESASTWSCGAVPTCGDSVVIPASKTVTITTVLDYTACATPLKITIKGTMTFQTGKKLKLSCGSKIFVYTGGKITSGGGGGSSNLIDICSVTEWTTSDGTLNGPDCLPETPGCTAALPVELVYFSATMTEKNEVKLTWQTASEMNNDYFTVENSSDGKHFSEVGKVKGSGNSTVLLSYSYIDHNSLRGVSYYRLKQTDYNGEYAYSRIVAVVNKNAVPFSLFPNPSTGESYITIDPLLTDEELQITVFNNFGQKIYSIDTRPASRNTIISLNDSNKKFVKGIYLVNVSSKDKVYSEKLFVN